MARVHSRRGLDQPLEEPSARPEKAVTTFGTPFDLNLIGLWTLYLKEVRRFLKVPGQTLAAPVVSALVVREPAAAVTLWASVASALAPDEVRAVEEALTWEAAGRA